MLGETKQRINQFVAFGGFPIDGMKTQKQHTKHLNFRETRETVEAHVKYPSHNEKVAHRNQISIDIEDYNRHEERDILTQ